MKILDHLTEVLLGVLVLITLVPVIIGQTSGANWTVTIGSTTIDLTFILLVVLLIALFGVIGYFAYKKSKK